MLQYTLYHIPYFTTFFGLTIFAVAVAVAERRKDEVTFYNLKTVSSKP